MATLVIRTWRQFNIGQYAGVITSSATLLYSCSVIHCTQTRNFRSLWQKLDFYPFITALSNSFKITSPICLLLRTLPRHTFRIDYEPLVSHSLRHSHTVGNWSIAYTPIHFGMIQFRLSFVTACKIPFCPKLNFGINL